MSSSEPGGDGVVMGGHSFDTARLDWNALRAMGLLAEKRNYFKVNHHKRTADLALKIAAELRVGDYDPMVLEAAALIHDMGEIIVPMDILTKPTKLSHIEFLLLKEHPKTAFDVLKEAMMPAPVAEIVLQHHELIDGSGYPFGLLEDDIMPESKILAVADCVEAMAAQRPYRVAHPVASVLMEIKQGRGVVFDARVVDACVKVFEKRGCSFADSP